MIGKQLGDYEVVGVIGEGGMGRVYLARNVHLPTMTVVLKTLKDSAQKDRFLTEANSLCLLDHVNICQIRHFFHSQGDLVIAMQYVKGKTLAELCEDWETIDLEAVHNIFIQVLNGLDYAHVKGVAHRDIKPDNIMVDDSGTVKIIDFGIARHQADARYTMTGLAVGTPQYMAPEQFTEERIEKPSLCDIYSLGISLYRLSCGRLPFEETNPFLLKEKHCSESPVRPSRINPQIPGSLERVILRAIEKKPQKRFPSAGAMRAALEASDPTASAPTAMIPGFSRPRRTWLLAIAAVAVLVIAGFALVQWGGLLESQPQLPPISFSFSPQTIDEGGRIAEIDLYATVPPADRSAIERWEYCGNRNMRVTIGNGGVASVSTPHMDWFGIDSVYFVAIRNHGQRDSALAVFRVRPINDPPMTTHAVTIASNDEGQFEPIDLGEFVQDVDDPDSAITWNWSTSPYLTVDADADGHVVVSPRAGWVGSTDVEFVAADRAGETDTLVATFAVTRSSDADAVGGGRYVTCKISPPSRVLIKGRIVTDEPAGMFDTVLANDVESLILMNAGFPLHTVRLAQGANNLQIDLPTQYSGQDRAILAANVIGGGYDGDASGSVLRINGAASPGRLGEPWKLIPGEYLIAPTFSSNRIDSIKFNQAAVSKSTRTFLLKSPRDNVRYNTLLYYVH